MTTSAHPPQTAICPLRIARHVSPCGWIRMLVSRPVTVVTCGAPERTSCQTGALLNGWVVCRCASCLAAVASWEFTAGDCAEAMLAASKSELASVAAIRTKGAVTLSPDISLEPVQCKWPSSRLVSAAVFVLILIALLDGELPLVAVAVELGTVPWRLIGLALILALLVLDHLRALAAARHHDDQHPEDEPAGNARDHDLPPVGAGAGAGGGAAAGDFPGSGAP